MLGRTDSPLLGSLVHFVTMRGAHRPAIVVEDWPQVEAYREDNRVNLQVFTDSSNDGTQGMNGLLWRTSVPQDEDGKAPGTWHWPEMD